MEILSDSSIHKTFESKSLSASELEDIEESISESPGSSRSAHETSISGKTLESRGAKVGESQSTSESETTETQSTLSGHSHKPGTPVHDESTSISSSLSSDSSNGEGTVDPRKYFLKRCINAAHQNGEKQSPEASDSSPEKPLEAEFCNNCIKAINSGNQTKEVKPAKNAEPTLLVDPLIIEKLKFERLLHTMREVTTKQEVTDDKQSCKVCRNWRSRVDETTFLRENIRHLRKQLTESRLQQHLITMDSLNQIGDLASGLPKVSDPSHELWKKLLKK